MNRLAEKLKFGAVQGLLIVIFAFLDAVGIDVCWAMTCGKHMSQAVFWIALFICVSVYSMAISIKTLLKD